MQRGVDVEGGGDRDTCAEICRPMCKKTYANVTIFHIGNNNDGESCVLRPLRVVIAIERYVVAVTGICRLQCPEEALCLGQKHNSKTLENLLC